MSSGDDKTEAPTPKRKREARQQGQIPKTTELGMWLQVLVGAIGIELTASRAIDGLRDSAADISTIAADPDPEVALGLFGSALGLSLTSVLPLAAVMVLVGIVALLSQTGLVFARKAAKPTWSRVNPLAGIKKLFKPQSAWQGMKSVIKLAALAAVSWSPILGITQELLDSGDPHVGHVASAVGTASIDLARSIAIVGIALALADYAFMRHQITKSLKMSKKDVKEEGRAAEGDPHVKGQIRRKQQEMSRNRMFAGVADASVVIVNPTHIAVAIRYEAGTGAPRVVAKGRGVAADRIREEAARHFVPIVRDIPLARTLERACKVDQTIPPDLYEAVARLLAFVMQVGRRAALLGGVLDNPAAARVALPEPV